MLLDPIKDQNVRKVPKGSGKEKPVLLIGQIMTPKSKTLWLTTRQLATLQAGHPNWESPSWQLE
jgi:hypothetical protein